MYRSILIFLFAAITLFTKANNIQIVNISSANNATNTGKIIQFDISWENSWLTSSPNNYDGAWVFFKVKDYTGAWTHLNFTNTNITVPSGCAYKTVPNGVGMFIHRSALGTGTVNFLNVKAGITSYPGSFEVRAFAIEMVNIPVGSFYVGDSSASTNAYRTGSVYAPFYMNVSSYPLYTGSGTRLSDPLYPASDTLYNFPTGVGSFWIMKYEVSVGAYRDFLNTLSYNQQVSRFFVSPNSASGISILNSNADVHYNYLFIETPGVSSSIPAVVRCKNPDSVSYEWKPICYITWPDAAAYLDWAGLSPITELEYEKACRGPLYPVPNELAWGTTTYNNWVTANGVDHILSITNNGKIDEFAPNASAIFGNASYGTVLPNGINYSTVNLIRGGAFANTISNRISSGASYYGVMELSGNTNEPTVTTANFAGRSFTGLHGDGILTSTGKANVDYWPGANGTAGTAVENGSASGGISGEAGIMPRGGYHLSTTATNLEISFRSSPYTGATLNFLRIGMGIRGVRR